MKSALPRQNIVCRDPDVVRVELRGGAFIGVFHAEKRVGGAVALAASDADAAEALVRALVDEVAGAAGCEPGVLDAKLAGSGPVLRALRRAAEAASLSIKGDHESTEPLLHAFFYTDSGRLRVQTSGLAQPAPPIAPAAPSPGARSEPRRRVRALIVDDSRAVRQVLTRILGSDPEIEVVGELENPLLIESRIAELRPDVVTLDIHMPQMSGVEVLEKLLPKHPIPVVMISSISMEEGTQVLRALELGAVDYIQKPSFEEMKAVGTQIAERVRHAAEAKVRRRAGTITGKRGPVSAAGAIDTSLLVAMGASTGGTEALKNIFLHLPAEIPPIVVVQHIPPVFSTAFANRLNEICAFEVKEAADGDEVRAGRVLIAPGGKHMTLTGKKGHYRVRVSDEGPATRHKPSVDVLFDSVASHAGKDAVGVILTGMGNDGAAGMLKMRNAGARTIAQDEASCAVFGMPREAIKAGAAESVHALEDIPEAMLKLLRRKHAA